MKRRTKTASRKTKNQSEDLKLCRTLLQPRRPTSSVTNAALRFSPTAWAKLLFLRDCGDTEVGGFGIAADDDLLFVRDMCLVRQTSSYAHVAFDDTSVADFFDEQVDEGRRPEQFARIWIHTHPGDCPLPSMTDEATFARVFGDSEWAIMFIIARGGQTFARLRFNVGPGGEQEIPVRVDFSGPFDGSDHEAWTEEYRSNVQNMNDIPDVFAVGESQVVDAADGSGARIFGADEFLSWDDGSDEWLEDDSDALNPDELEQLERQTYE